MFAIFVVSLVFVNFTPRAANDLPYVYKELLDDSFRLPQTWSDAVSGLGSYTLLTLWSWPFAILYAAGSKLGLSFATLQAVIALTPTFFLSFYGVVKVLSSLGVESRLAKCGAALFTLNTYLFLLVDGGQLSVAMAYSLTPLAYWLFLKATREGLQTRTLAALFFALLVALDIRFTFILFILLALRFCFQVFLEPRKFITFLRGYLLTGVVCVVAAVFLNTYWLLPAFLVRAPELPATYQRVSEATSFSFANIKHVILLQQPHWPENVFGKVVRPSWEFVLIPVFAFVAILVSKRKKEALFWTLVSLLGIFLATGPVDVFGNIYTWIFTNIPGFSYFRDSSKYFTILALGYAVLASLSIEGITLKLKSFKAPRPVLFAVPFCFLVYLLIIARPILGNQMNGLFGVPSSLVGNAKLVDRLREDESFSKVFWIPKRTPLGFVSPLHPVLESIYLTNLRPFASGVVGRYESQNYLREANYMGEIFNILGVKYLVYPDPNTEAVRLKDDELEYYNAFGEQLAGLPWIKYKLEESSVPVYETHKHKDLFFVAPRTVYVVGSDQIYRDLVETPEFDLSQNAFVFAEETPESFNMLPENAEILLHDKTQLDLDATAFPKEQFVSLASYLPFDPEEGVGFWKRETADFIWMRDFLQQKYGIDNSDFDYGQGYAISEGNSNLEFTNPKLQKGDKLLVRVLKSSKGGKVEFWQGDKNVGEVNTRVVNPEKVEINLQGHNDIPDIVYEYDKSSFNWYEVGVLSREDDLTIKTSGDINIVNALVSISENDWSEIKNKVDSRYVDSSILDFSDYLTNSQFLYDRSAKVDYERIAPTHYKVKVNGITGPSTLVFSQNFDSLWSLEGKSPTKVYGLLNGFELKEDGEYDLYFTPQKYILPGLVVSAASLVTIFIILGYNVMYVKSKKR